MDKDEERGSDSPPQSRASSAGKQRVELGPVRTGRDTPSGERPGSAALLLAEQESVTEIQLTPKEPLPPIQSETAGEIGDLEDPEATKIPPTVATSEEIGN